MITSHLYVKQPHFFIVFFFLLYASIMDQNQMEVSSADHHDQQGIVNHKSCTDCKTTETPLWRGGPAGPKSLCNACGIRQRKNKNIMLGVNKKLSKKQKQKKDIIKIPNCKSKKVVDETSGEEKISSENMRVKLITMGKEVVVLQRQRSQIRRKLRRNMGEVEEAALLLMYLSRGGSSV